MPNPPWPLVALATASAVTLLALVARVLARSWAEHAPRGALALVLPVLAAASVVIVPPASRDDPHAAYVAALRADPFLVFHAQPHEEPHGPWSVAEGGRAARLPYARTLHLLAWLPALVVGESLAVRVVSGAAAGSALVLVFTLARALGAPPFAGVIAQALALTAPALLLAVAGARHPAILGLAATLTLVVHLVRRLPAIEAARDGAAACFFLFAVQLAYTGTVAAVAALVLALAVLQAVAGERRRARWLLGAWLIALGVVVVVQYAWSVPALWVHRGTLLGREGPSPLAWLLGGGAITSTVAGAGRALLALGALAALPDDRRHARRVVLAALLAPALLLAASVGTAPRLALARHAVELFSVLAAALGGVAAAAGWQRGGMMRLLATTAVATAIMAGLLRAM